MENYKKEREKISKEIDSKLSFWMKGHIDKSEDEIKEYKKRLENLSFHEIRNLKLKYLTELSILDI